MKQEIDILTTEDSIAFSPEFASPSLRNNISRLSASNLCKEESLKSLLQESEGKLSALYEQKRLICGTRKEKSNIITHKIEWNKEDILRLEKQLEILEINSANMTNEIKKQNQQKLEAFKIALKPLQDVAEMIQASTNSLNAKKIEIQNSLEELLKIESENQSQLETKKLEKQEVKQKKKSVMEALQEMKNQKL